MEQIELSNCDKYLIVDEDDYHIIAHFTWRARKSHREFKYVVHGKDGFYVHDAIMKIIPEGHIVDHINGDGFDNRRSNLRIIPKEKNTRNRLES